MKLMLHELPQPNLDRSSGNRSWSVRFWGATAMTGVACGIIGGLLMRLLELVERVAWKLDSGTLLDAVRNTSMARRITLVLAAGLIVSFSGGLIRRIFGRPGEVDSAIWFRSGRVPTLPTLAQAIDSTVIVGLGTSLGRESAIKQAGGAIASRLAAICRLSRGETRLLVACGVGAGMAAAYNVPVGGALFAIEVLLGSISLRMILPALFCSAISTATSWVLLPTGPVYDVPEYPLSIPLTIWSVWAGPLLGLAGVMLVRAIAWVEGHRPQSQAQIFLATAVVFTLLGLTSTAFPELLGNGQDVVQIAFNAKFSLVFLIVLPVLKAVATVGCLASGAHGGLFTPSLTIGALLGGLLGHAWEVVWPGASMGCCSVIGACAFLAAASQGPISALVLVLELTRHVDATMAPMLIAVSGAMFVARLLESQSIYSVRILSRVRQAQPSQNEQFSPYLRFVTGDFITVSSAMKYSGLLQQMVTKNWKLPAFVVDHEGLLEGQIDQSSLAEDRLGPMPLDAAKAGDVVVTVAPLELPNSPAEIKRRLQQSSDVPLPVVEASSRRLLGVVNRDLRVELLNALPNELPLK